MAALGVGKPFPKITNMADFIDIYFRFRPTSFYPALWHLSGKFKTLNAPVP
jgi:hypothetical protein